MIFPAALIFTLNSREILFQFIRVSDSEESLGTDFLRKTVFLQLKISEKVNDSAHLAIAILSMIENVQGCVICNHEYKLTSRCIIIAIFFTCLLLSSPCYLWYRCAATSGHACRQPSTSLPQPLNNRSVEFWLLQNVFCRACVVRVTGAGRSASASCCSSPVMSKQIQGHQTRHQAEVIIFQISSQRQH